VPIELAASGTFGHNLPGGHQRALVLMRAAPVHRQLYPGGPVPSGRRCGLNRLREPAMRDHPLTGKEVGEHSLAEQLMPETIAVGVADQYVRGYGRTQRAREGGVVEIGRRSHQRVRDMVSAHRGHPQCLLRFRRQLFHSGENQVPQRPRQPGDEAAVPVHERLGEQRVSTAAPVDSVNEGRPGRITQNSLQLSGDVAAGQRL